MTDLIVALLFRGALSITRRLTPAQRAELQALLFPRIEITGRDGEPISPADRQAKRGTKC